ALIYIALPPPSPRAEIVSCDGTRIYCNVKANLSWILRLQPGTSFLRVNYIQNFLVHTIKTAIQKLQLFRFSLY
ncbi:MAG: hypothetical protein PHN94_05945, partial [Bacteroidales bacterium]|nr:hypothetical protein [Bacteroidales bacterium]